MTEIKRMRFIGNKNGLIRILLSAVDVFYFVWQNIGKIQKTGELYTQRLKHSDIWIYE